MRGPLFFVCIVYTGGEYERACHTIPYYSTDLKVAVMYQDIQQQRREEGDHLHIKHGYKQFSFQRKSALQMFERARKYDLHVQFFKAHGKVTSPNVSYCPTRKSKPKGFQFFQEEETSF